MSPSGRSPATNGLQVRTMRPDEISIAVNWAAAEGWNPGLADDACFAAADPGGFFQRTMELSEGAFEIDVHRVLADDDLVVALVTVNAQRNGISASFPEVHVWRMKGGKAAEFREYQGDEQREDRFWS